MTGASTAIRVRGLTKSYRRRRVLHGLSIDLPAGSITALIGENGAGKSTLIHCILGLVRPERGSCEIFGVPATDEAARAGVGFLPEDPAFEPGLRVRTVLALHRTLAAGARESDRQLLGRVELSLPSSRLVRRTSRGEARRLALACALIGRPRLLVLDEPTSGMDPAARRRFLGWLARFRDGGGTALVSSHVLDELRGICDRYVALKQGRLLASDRLIAGRRDGELEQVLQLEVGG